MVADDNRECHGCRTESWGGRNLYLYRIRFAHSGKPCDVQAYADSVRAVRAENNGVNPALSKSTKVTNPFESMDILNRINAKIKELANVPIPNIADYKLVNEKGATKYYEVKELNTGKTFCVDFYFYGGILSGWNVTVK
mgnify:CR=1 FL=1